MNTLAYLFGYWLAGFTFSMIAGYIFLLPAGSPKRRPGTAALLRVLAVFASALLAYASFMGGDGRNNFGAVLAVPMVLFLAARQSRRSTLHDGSDYRIPKMNSEKQALLTRGWRRLFIVLSIIWLISSVSWVATERYFINPFEQFDAVPKKHLYWEWGSPITPLKPIAIEVKTGRKVYSRKLSIKPFVTVSAMLGPIALLWFIGWCTAWISDGFKK